MKNEDIIKAFKDKDIEVNIYQSLLIGITKIYIDTSEHDAKIRAYAEEDAEYRMNRILDDEKRLSYEQGKADAFKEFVDLYRKFSTTPYKETCLKEDIECDGMCIDCFEKWVQTKAKEQKK